MKKVVMGLMILATLISLFPGFGLEEANAAGTWNATERANENASVTTGNITINAIGNLTISVANNSTVNMYFNNLTSIQCD